MCEIVRQHAEIPTGNWQRRQRSAASNRVCHLSELSLFGYHIVMNSKGLIAIDAQSLRWEERYIERIGLAIFRKELFNDPETGVLVRLVCYPAGVINPKHTHPCGHGMYVLEGNLVTHKGTFAPGTFVWFPEGEVMEHGASTEGDVTVLLVTNKAFRIDYVG
jgi:quercetin dioxygenase-like cupin family protein